MDKLFHTVMEVIYWFLIVLSPVFLFGLVGLLVLISFDAEISVLSISLAAGAIVGIMIAERIRRRYGCVNFWSNIVATPDIAAKNDNLDKHKQ